MKLAAVAALLAAVTVPAAPGCIPGCQQPSDCIGGNVCAADGQCHAAGDLEPARVTWTIGGQPASTATCGGAQLLVGFVVGFGRDEAEYTYGPVPCEAGVYTNTLVPSFDEVEVGYDVADDFDHGQFATPDDTGAIEVDLPPPM